MTLVIAARDVSAAYGPGEVFRGVTFQVPSGQMLGVIGSSGAGKTTLLRMLVGLMTPRSGDIRIHGRPPRHALARESVAYFAGEGTLPGAVRAAVWPRLAGADLRIAEPRVIRALSRGARQRLGLRTVLSRHPLDVIVVDEPWESLDQDDRRWLSATLEAKRDRGAAVVVASHRLADLAGLCDLYLLLLPHQPVLVKAHEITPVGPVTTPMLTDLVERLRHSPSGVVDGRLRARA